VASALLAPRLVRAMPVQGGERALSFLHTHTGERLSLAYWGDGQYLPDGMARVEAFLLAGR